MTITHSLNERSEDLASLIRRVAAAKRFVIVTGAGISVNCGIPDFRSPDGIFKQIQKAHGDVVASGRDLFDASVVFRSEKTADVFYHWMTHLRHQCSSAHPGVVHGFIKRLADRGSLLRSYTQNIDGLERKAGLAVWDPYSLASEPNHVSWQRAQSVPLHGSMERLMCQLCSSSYHFSEQPGSNSFSAGDVCPDCQARSIAREASGRRALPAGKLRPTVVLYEEPHPHCEDIAKIITHDARALGSRRTSANTLALKKKVTDVVLIFGTTLKVPGCRQLVKQLAKASPSTTATIFVNNEPVCGKTWDGIIDYQVLGNVEDWCARVERQWDSQTKITQWAKTYKQAHLRNVKGAGVRQGEKENRTLISEPASKKRKHEPRRVVAEADATEKIKRARAGTGSPAEPEEVPAAKKRRHGAAHMPIRRSLRIAERESLEHHHSAYPSIAICT